MMRTRIYVCIAVAATTVLVFGASVDAQIGTRYYNSYQANSNHKMWDVYGINPYTKTTTANSRYCYRPGPVTLRPVNRYSCQSVFPQTQTAFNPVKEDLFAPPVANEPTLADISEAVGAKSVIEAPSHDPHLEVEATIETDPSQPSLSDVPLAPSQPILSDPAGTEVTKPIPVDDEKSRLENEINDLRNRLRANKERSKTEVRNAKKAIENLNQELKNVQQQAETMKQQLNQKLDKGNDYP